jgi:hypothetical protein
LSRPKSDSLSQNMLLESDWTRKFEWNSAKRKRWTHSKWCPEMVPNAGKRTNLNFWKWLALHTWTFFAKFFHYPLPLSEEISSFLFLRNTFQFLGRHSKCDVWRVSHHWETGKTLQNKCFERKPLKCPQGVLRHQNCLYIFVQKLWETLISR